MKIEIWSDVVYPFCYIGKRKLDKALEQFEHKENVETVFRSFQLSPDAKKNTGMDIHQLIASSYGTSYEKAKQMNTQVAMQAKEVGLDYHFDTLIPTNSYDALRLSYFAKDKGKMAHMIERIMKAYHVDSLDIGDHATLAHLAKEIGLDEKEALEVLSDNRYGGSIANDRQKGMKKNIRSVPFFIINDKYTLTGAQSSEAFLELLQQAWNEEYVNAKADNEDDSSIDAYCSEGACKLH